MEYVVVVRAFLSIESLRACMNSAPKGIVRRRKDETLVLLINSGYFDIPYSFHPLPPRCLLEQ